MYIYICLGGNNIHVHVFLCNLLTIDAYSAYLQNYTFYIHAYTYTLLYFRQKARGATCTLINHFYNYHTLIIPCFKRYNQI